MVQSCQIPLIICNEGIVLVTSQVLLVFLLLPVSLAALNETIGVATAFVRIGDPILFGLFGPIVSSLMTGNNRWCKDTHESLPPQQLTAARLRRGRPDVKNPLHRVRPGSADRSVDVRSSIFLLKPFFFGLSGLPFRLFQSRLWRPF
jgi:hypothetical protein